MKSGSPAIWLREKNKLGKKKEIPSPFKLDNTSDEELTSKRICSPLSEVGAGKHSNRFHVWGQSPKAKDNALKIKVYSEEKQSKFQHQDHSVIESLVNYQANISSLDCDTESKASEFTPKPPVEIGYHVRKILI